MPRRHQQASLTGNSFQTDFTGKLVLVTGAAQGIGKTVVETLRAYGASVISIDKKLAHQPQAKQFQVDLTQAAAVQACVDEIEAHIGPIDFLVNVAGLLQTGNLLDYSAEHLQQTFQVNTFAVFYITQSVARYMVQRQQGAIVTVSSNAAHTPRLNMGAYSASKAACSQLMRNFGLELAKHHIRCNTVAPGSTNTAMLWDLNPSQEVEPVIQGSAENYRLGIPLQCIASTQQVADTVTFLLSSLASHITMENITVDGGATLGC